MTEQIVAIGVGRFDVSLLRPDPGHIAREHIDGTGVSGTVVALIAVDAGRGAVLEEGVDRQRVA